MGLCLRHFGPRSMANNLEEQLVELAHRSLKGPSHIPNSAGHLPTSATAQGTGAAAKQCLKIWAAAPQNSS